MTGYAYMRTSPYNACVREFQHDGKALADLEEALAELAEQPFNNPRLQTHHVKARSGRKTFISYVGGSKGKRLIWQLVNQTIVLLLFGGHDKVERRAERLDYEIDDVSGGVRIVEYETRPQPAVAPVAEARAEGTVGSLFMAWSDDELASLGFASQEIPVLRRLDHEDELLALEPTMAADSFTAAMNLHLYGDPQGQRTAAREPQERYEVKAAGSEVRAEVDAGELERKLTAPASRASFAAVAPDQLAEVLAQPIEDWMVFLHPDQARLVQRPFSGPARVRGPAGTGKTVVALHRAKHLAETYGPPVLFTTFVRNLPTVFEQLYRRFAPDTADHVEFVNLHKWAWRYLAQHGHRPNTDIGKIDRAYKSAWETAVTSASLIDRQGGGFGYYREELDWIIKGRGLREFDDYLALSRTGRGTPLSEPHRREVWALYEEYERQLAREGVEDFNDVLTQALTRLQADPSTAAYTAVVVDEAQDLTEVGIRLLHTLAGVNVRDGLFICGDGQQSVYPGGYSLGQIGVDVRGRSAVLRINYRNTRQILDAADRIAADRPFDDLDDDLAHGPREIESLREGVPPHYDGFVDLDDHDTALVAAIDDAARDPTLGPGDIAVLLPTNRLVDEYAKRIHELGYDTQELTKYDGTPNGQVKVGTYQRGKGLEFKAVFLPRLEPNTVGDAARFHEDEHAHAERLELTRRRLFVSATRARDYLWCGWVGAPTKLLNVDARDEA